MSFRCQITGKAGKPGDKPIKIVTKTRPKDYYEQRYNEETDRYELQKVGSGFEIVEEILVSDEGVKLWNKLKQNA